MKNVNIRLILWNYLDTRYLDTRIKIKIFFQVFTSLKLLRLWLSMTTSIAGKILAKLFWLIFEAFAKALQLSKSHVFLMSCILLLVFHLLISRTKPRKKPILQKLESQAFVPSA